MSKLKGSLFIAVLLIALDGCNTGKSQNTKISDGEVIHLTSSEFKTKVFDYSLGNTWKFKGDKPVIVDFYASWCAPCRMLSPVLEDLAKEYKDQITIYKIDTQSEEELSRQMGISSIPTLLLIPKHGQPQTAVGFMPKEALKKAIDDVLLTN